MTVQANHFQILIALNVGGLLNMLKLKSNVGDCFSLVCNYYHNDFQRKFF